MTTGRKQHFARLMLEGLVIVLSILLAFWIDAAWELRCDRIQALEFLEAVRSELADNVEILAGHVERCEGGAVAAQRQLVALTGPRPAVVSADSVTNLMASSLAGVPPRLQTPAFDALVSAGVLADIGSAELRREFGRWRTLLEGRESRRTISEDQVIKTIDYLESVGAAAPLHEGSRVGLPPSNFTLDVEALLGDREVRAGLAKRFSGMPDVHYGEDQHRVCGDLGISEWTLTGTTVSGRRIEVRGVDILEFVGGKTALISRSSSSSVYGKCIRPARA